MANSGHERYTRARRSADQECRTKPDPPQQAAQSIRVEDGLTLGFEMNIRLPRIDTVPYQNFHAGRGQLSGQLPHTRRVLREAAARSDRDSSTSCANHLIGDTESVYIRSSQTCPLDIAFLSASTTLEAGCNSVLIS